AVGEPPPGVFVGREAELAALGEGLEAALAGHGRLFLLVGEPGIGKSRLAEEVARRANERGATLLVGRCWEAGGAPAYWPWVQSLRSYIEGLEPAELRTQLGAGAADIAQIIPEIRERLPGLPEPSLDEEGARFRLFDTAARFLRNAAAVRPLVLILDDLHAADEPSLLLLRFVATELARSRVLVVGTYRDVDPAVSDPLGSTLAELARERVTHRLQLAGLTAVDVGRYIELSVQTRPTPELVETISAETEGNPLFLGEMIRLLAAEGRLTDADAGVSSSLGIPQGIRDVIERRLRRLSEQCKRVLTLASVLGREFGLDALEHVADVREHELLEALDEAVTARILTSVPGAPGRLRFAHALIRETLYERMTELRRVHLHRQVGTTLEAAYAADAEPHLAELAHHFWSGQDFGKALDYSRRAGDRALGLLAYEEAERLYLNALDAFEIASPGDHALHCALLVALGEARSRAGDADGARDTFFTAAELARRQRLPRWLALAALGYGGRLVFARAGNDPRIVPLLEQALETLDDADEALRARLLARLAGALRDEPSPARRKALSAEGLALARTLSDGATLAYALDGRVAALLGPHDHAEQIELATELIAVGAQVGDTERAVFGHLYRAHAHLYSADPAAADADFAAATSLADELRVPTAFWLVEASAAMRALLDGRFTDAEQLIERARAVGARAQSLESLAAHSVQRYLLLRHQDRVQEVEDELEQAAAAFPARPVCRCVLASARALIGKEGDAGELFANLAADEFRTIPQDMEWLFAASVLAELCNRFADREAAAALYELLLPWEHSTATDLPEGSLGSVARGLGLLAGTLGRYDEAERHFRVAADVNARLRSPVWLAYTRHDHGRLLIQRGELGAAEALFAEALEAARSL
ncbi:MAG: AAA family ATPase, partial [Thermoleophilia bacterium]|nr:AAA family ATPase [Thermoleophilia bacterium]